MTREAAVVEQFEIACRGCPDVADPTVGFAGICGAEVIRGAENNVIDGLFTDDDNDGDDSMAKVRVWAPECGILVDEGVQTQDTAACQEQGAFRPIFRRVSTEKTHLPQLAHYTLA